MNAIASTTPGQRLARQPELLGRCRARRRGTPRRASFAQRRGRRVLADLDAAAHLDAERLAPARPRAARPRARILYAAMPCVLSPPGDLAPVVDPAARSPSRASSAAQPRLAGPAPTQRDPLAVRRRPPSSTEIPRSSTWSVAKRCSAPDRDRPLLLVVQHAGALAEHLDRAHARAGVAEHVRFQDRPRGAAQVAGRDLADERRDVDLGRARPDAGRVVAVEAARGLVGRRDRRQPRVDVGEVALVGRVVESGCRVLHGNAATLPPGGGDFNAGDGARVRVPALRPSDIRVPRPAAARS